jgi:hypothetical protein
MSNIKLSYGITVCNELEEVKRLVNFLLSNKREEDEICVLLDKPKCPPPLLDQLYRFSSANWIKLKESSFQGHFADWKNELTRMCSGDYIFAIDADEIPHKALIDNLPAILESNPDNEVYLVPRVNTVEGITKRHTNQWGWRLSKIESPNLIEEKEMDTESEEYKLLKEGGFIIEEHSVSI